VSFSSWERRLGEKRDKLRGICAKGRTETPKGGDMSRKKKGSLRHLAQSEEEKKSRRGEKEGSQSLWRTCRRKVGQAKESAVSQTNKKNGAQRFRGTTGGVTGK